jgi:penicillin-binding protein 1B
LVQIGFSENRVGTIIRMESGETMPILELEPEEIMQFFGQERERRQLISIEQVPEHLIQAVLAAEDHRFFQHYGVDFRGLFRALITNLRHGSIRQGGSTLTQQLAKNYFLTPARTITRKFKEVILSVIIELKYDKREILEIYLNEIYLGQKGSVAINGFGEAAYFYFGKPVNHLTLSEAAVIAGLIKAPNHYSPYRDITRCQSPLFYRLPDRTAQHVVSPGRSFEPGAFRLHHAGHPGPEGRRKGPRKRVGPSGKFECGAAAPSTRRKTPRGHCRHAAQNRPHPGPGGWAQLQRQPV